ncbi:MAG: class I SAM-dependent methyltransferase [bacterium]|nr:class I SAM-dependent methyltransferase [bacterium]
MPDYYSEKLSAERLKRVYEIAPLRTRQYLDAEVEFVLDNIDPGDAVLELGCGYGRILPRLAEKAGTVFGIDSSYASLTMGREMFGTDFVFATANAATLPFADAYFDCVVCIQNGISAFHEDKRQLIAEVVRVTRPGGRALFSSYSDNFWDDRLEWFRMQADEGLLGEIDYEKTGDGDIVCKDGFTATTVRPDAFESLAVDLNLKAEIVEVDGSSLFCVIEV